MQAVPEEAAVSTDWIGGVIVGFGWGMFAGVFALAALALWLNAEDADDE